MDAATDEAAGPRGLLRVGAGSVARHQLALALALQCELVVCITRTLLPEVVELQHAVERAGARFHAVNGPHALVSLITSADDLFVIGDGVLAAPSSVLPLLEPGNAVLVQPVESGIAAGFERLDMNHASAGVLRMPGRLAQSLAGLPGDYDTVSSLIRAAIQAGIPMRQVPAEARQGARWSLIASESEAGAIEASWLALHNPVSRPVSPGSLLAALIFRLTGPAMLHAGSGGNIPAAGSLASAALGLGLGWFGWTTFALCLGAIAWLIVGFAGILRTVERESLCLGPDRWSRDLVFAWILDAALVAILVWNQQLPVWTSLSSRLFAPLVLLCMIRLLARAFSGIWVNLVEDRFLLALLLAAASAFGVLDVTVQAVAVTLGIIGIVLPASGSRLTRA